MGASLVKLYHKYMLSYKRTAESTVYHHTASCSYKFKLLQWGNH